MSKVTSNIPAYFNTDANFQAWVTAIHNALSTLGFVQTADTGQINPATVGKPGAGGTVAGYEVWRFSDTHQADAPIYFKLEYGSSNVATDPQLWFTAGSGSNGAGTLTGQVGNRSIAGSATTKSAGVTLPFYACGDGSDLALAVNIDTAGQGGMFIYIGRPRDSSGNATGDGAWQYVLSTSSNTTGQGVFMPVSGTVPAALAGVFPGINPGLHARSAQGDNACICMAMHPVWGNWRFHRLGLCNPTDFPAGGSLTATIFGGSHVFLSLAQAMSSGNLVAIGNGGAPGIVMPWE